VRCSGLDQRVRRLDEHSQGTCLDSSNQLQSRRRADSLPGSAPGPPPSACMPLALLGQKRQSSRSVRGSRRGPRKRRPLRRLPTRSIAAVTPSGARARNSLEQSIAIDDRLYSETAKSLLLVLTRGSDHSGAVGYRELHGHQAHASGRPVHQQSVPGARPGRSQCVDRRDARQHQSARLFEGHRRGLWQHAARGARRPVA